MTINAGAVSIDVQPDLTGFGTRLKAGLTKSVAGASANVEINPDLTGFRSSLKLKLGAAMAGVSKDVKVSSSQMASSLGGVKDAIKGINVNLGMLGRLWSVMKWPAIIGMIGTAVGAIGALGAGAIALVSSLGYAASSAVSLVAALAPLSGMLVAYPAILMAVGQGFGVVKLAMDAAMMSSLKQQQSILVMQQAMVGLTGQELIDAQAQLKVATDAYTASLNKLTPAQQGFVRDMVPMNEEMLKLKEIAGNYLLPSIGAGFNQLRVLFPLIESTVAQTATTLSGIFYNFTAMITSSSWQRDLDVITGMNNQTLWSLAQMMMGFTDGFRNIYMSARPLINFLQTSFVKIGQSFGQWAAAGRKSGGLREFFEKTIEVAKLLAPIIMNVGHIFGGMFKAADGAGMKILESISKITGEWSKWMNSMKGQNSMEKFFNGARKSLSLVSGTLGNLFKTLGNIMQAAKPLGDSLFKSFEKVTGEWAKFTGSAKGQNTLKKFFADAKPVLTEAGKLLGGILKIFGDLATNNQIADVLKMLRTDFLPVLEDIAKSANAELVPAFMDLAKGGLRIFAQFATPGGPLLKVVQGLAKMANNLMDFLAEHPKLQSFVTTLVSMAAIFSALGGPAIVGAIAKIGQLIALRMVYTAQQTAMAAATAATAGAETAAAGATGLWAGAMNVLKGAMAFMLANPIVLAIAAIAAVIALVLVKTGAWKVIWEWMKKWAVIIWNGILDAAKAFWNWIKPVAEVVIQAIIIYFKLLWEEAKLVWRLISAAAKVAWEIIKAVWKVVAPWFKLIWRLVWHEVKRAWDLITGAIKIAWNIIKEVWKVAGPWFKALWHGVVGVVRVVWGNIKKFIGPIVEWIATKIEWIIDKIRGAIEWADKLIHKVSDALGLSSQGQRDADERTIAMLKGMLTNSTTKDDSFAYNMLKNDFGIIAHGVPGFARGGVAFRPTLGVFGERGPEALVPLEKSGLDFSGSKSGGMGEIHGSITIDNWATGRGMIRAVSIEEASRVSRQTTGRGRMNRD